MLKIEGIQCQVCRNPDLKCSIVETAQRTIRDKAYKYFTYSNTNSYIDILQKFVDAYYDTVHSATGMAPLRITDSDVLAIWEKMNKHIRGVRTISVRFRVGQHVRISKEKMKFEKGAEKILVGNYFELTRLLRGHPGLSTSWKI